MTLEITPPRFLCITDKLTITLELIPFMAKQKNERIGRINVPKVDEDWVPVTALMSEEVPVDSFLCNFDFEDKENAHLLFLANKPAMEKADALIGKKLKLAYYVVMKKRIPDRQNGGECDVIQTTLIDLDMNVIQTMSVGALKSLELLRRQVGAGAINPPVAITIRGDKTGPGSSMLMIVPDVVGA